jgi:hypothetical protein
MMLQPGRISYGKNRLIQTSDRPVQDYESLRREQERASFLTAPGSAGTGSMSDSRGLLASRLRNIPSAAVLLEGVIAHVIPGTYTYKVILDGHQGVLICGDMMSPAFSRSVKISCLYPVGTRVLVLRLAVLGYGVILGSPEAMAADSRYALPFLASGIGSFHVINRQYVRDVALSPDMTFGVPDYVNGRAADICEGEYMISNLSEGGFFTSPYMTSVRQTPGCGVWMFSMDSLLRTAGRSVQEYSRMHERYRGTDEAELYGFEGTALYPWEALGYYSRPDSWYQHHDGTDTVNGKGIGFCEPVNPDAVPFYRFREHTGYLGQGFLREVYIPPPDEPDLHSPDSSQDPVCVSRQHFLPDGTILQESAKAMHFVKHVNLRSFERIREIDDPQGDDSRDDSGYSFSDAPPPFPEETLPTETDQLLRAVRNDSPSAFRAHRKDFREGEPLSVRDAAVGLLVQLLTQNSVEEPPSVQVKTDDRRGTSLLFAGRSSLSFLSNGDVVIRNAGGCELALRGSNLEIDVPGDTRIRSGRSLIALAGDDAVIRAKNSVDITATDNDVRVKAERNLEMAGGLSGAGGVLIEDQSRGYPSNSDVAGLEGESVRLHGLTLKSDHSLTTLSGQSVYVRSNDRISLDAGQGKGNIRSVCSGFYVDAASSVILGVGIQGSRPGFLRLGSSSMTVSTYIECHSSIFSREMIVSDAGISTGAATNFSKPLPSSGKTRPQLLDENIQWFRENVPGWYETYVWAEGAYGNPETVENYTFSYRTPQQCGADRYEWRQPYWMELYGEEAVSVLATWSEPVYMYQGRVSQQPWPGYAPWTEETSLRAASPLFYDAAEGRDIDRPQGEPVVAEHTPGAFLRITDPQ